VLVLAELRCKRDDDLADPTLAPAPTDTVSGPVDTTATNLPPVARIHLEEGVFQAGVPVSFFDRSTDPD